MNRALINLSEVIHNFSFLTVYIFFLFFVLLGKYFLESLFSVNSSNLNSVTVPCKKTTSA